jgi:hypothetical protein
MPCLAAAWGRTCKPTPTRTHRKLRLVAAVRFCTEGVHRQRWQTSTFRVAAAAAAAAAAGCAWAGGRECCVVYASSGQPRAERIAEVTSAMSRLYAGLAGDPSHGPALSQDEEDTVDATGGSHIYGEITCAGVDMLLAWVSARLDNAAIPMQRWQFVDLGSGVGRMCIQASQQWGAVRSTGVELSQARHNVAVVAGERARRLGLVPAGSALHFECEDLLLTKSLRAHSTGDGGCKVGVYVASLLFDDEMMVRLASLLEQSSDVRWVASLQRLPRPPLADFHLDAVLSLPMSWDEEARTEVYVYLRGVKGSLSESAEGSASMGAEEADVRAHFAR